MLPQALARIDPRTSSPTAAVLLMIVMGVIFILVRTFNDLASNSSSGSGRSTPGGRGRLRAAPHAAAARAALHDVGLSAGAGRVPRGGAVRIGELLVSETLKFAVDIGIIATGVPVYLVIRRYQRRAPPPAILVRDNK